MMKGYQYFCLIATMALAACSNEDENIMPGNVTEIVGIEATIDGEQPSRRAAATPAVTVGRTEFVTDDRIVFTNIKRTTSPLESFTYSNIRYYFTDKKNWKRTEGNLPEKIYWTDGSSPHTFIGYSLPSQQYYWEDNGDNTYSGELGHELTVIDYTEGNEALKKEDLLLNYDTKTVAETGGLSTKVIFTHALSNVRVVVNIKNFASSASAVDTKVGVGNMVLHKQPTKFKWGIHSSKVQVLDINDSEQTTKDLMLWCPAADGEGTGQSKTFTFYGLTTPQDELYHHINGNDQPLAFSFTVSYPNPMNPAETLTKTYSGAFNDLVHFNPGMCTTINISLNHKDEQMFTDVSYSDWNFVATPDLGELRKKSTFLDINSNVTIHTDAQATIYDATWLYNDGTVLRDIYGNDGTVGMPYRISTASQLLSFAKEVTAGLTFKDKYIRLDADITMQSSSAKTNLEDTTSTQAAVKWIGIGTAAHPFEGTFLGGDRFVNRLYDAPLFACLGSQARVEQLHITTIGSISGGGALAQTNQGIIGGCKVIDDVQTAGGALVGTNSGIIYASYHTGDTKGTAGLVDTNTGTIVGCYQAGDVAGGTAFSIAKTNQGTIACPVPTSLYEIQQQAFTDQLNSQLDSWYATHADYTLFHYVHAAANWPTVQRQ
ncbi:MAG: fimbrillin family protein [Prevotella sp.]|nr:fimbrillin family protein [Prevotella sp.]